jgi:hypothetical protein
MMIQEEPDVLRWKVQLAQEYRSDRDWEELAAFSEQCLAECANVNNKYANYDIGTFYAGKILGYLYMNQLDRGIAACEEELRDPRNSEMSHANTYHYLGMFALYQKDWKKAEDCMHKFLSMERELKKDPVKLEEQKWGLIVCEAFDELPMKRAYSVLIVCGWKQHHLDALHKYFKKLKWDKKTIYQLDKMPEYLTEAVATLPQDQVLDEMLALGWKNEGMKLKLFACAEGWKERDREAYYRILRSMSRIKDAHWYPSYAAVMYAAHTGKKAALADLIDELAGHLDNIFLLPQEVRTVAVENGIPLEPVYLAVPFEKWCESLQEYIQTVGRGDLRITVQELKETQKTDNIRYDYAFARLAEALATADERGWKYEDRHPLFVSYAKSVRHLCKGYYQESVAQEYPELLPDYVAAGVLVGQALDVEESSLPEAVRLYHRAAQMNPVLQRAVKAYIVSLQNHVEMEERKREEEFQLLLRETKRQVRDFLAKGNHAAARGILTQLKQLAPEDLEVAELMLRTRLAEGGRENE